RTVPNFAVSFSNSSSGFGSVLGSRLSWTVLPCPVRPWAWWNSLPRSRPRNRSVPTVSTMLACPLDVHSYPIPAVPAAPHAGNHVTQTFRPQTVRRCAGPDGRQAPHQRSSGAPKPGGNTPQVMHSTGGKQPYRTRGPGAPLRGHEKDIRWV